MFDLANEFPLFKNHSIKALCRRIRKFEALREEGGKSEQRFNDEQIRIHGRTFEDSEEGLRPGKFFEARLRDLRRKLEKEGCKPLEFITPSSSSYVNLEKEIDRDEVVAIFILNTSLGLDDDDEYFNDYDWDLWDEIGFKFWDRIRCAVYLEDKSWVEVARSISGEASQAKSDYEYETIMNELEEERERFELEEYRRW